MSKSDPYVVWTSENEADRVPADFVIALLDEIQFFKDGKNVKSYKRDEFLKYNTNWVEQENTE